MPSQNGNGGRGDRWGSGAKPDSDIENLVRQGQERLKRILPSGHLRSVIVLPSYGCTTNAVLSPAWTMF